MRFLSKDGTGNGFGFERVLYRERWVSLEKNIARAHLTERENLCVLFYLLVREIERERRQKDQVIVIRGFGVEQRRSLIVNEF